MRRPPEAQAVYQAVDIADFFPDHSFDFGWILHPFQIASRPWFGHSLLAFHGIRLTPLGFLLLSQWSASGTTDERWAEWVSSFEQNLTGFVNGQPHHRLQPSQCGRRQQDERVRVQPNELRIRPNRPSEVPF